MPASIILAAAGGRFIVTPTPNYALYGWLAFGALVVLCVAVAIYRRSHPAPIQRWEQAKNEAWDREEAAARIRSSEELHTKS